MDQTLYDPTSDRYIDQSPYSDPYSTSYVGSDDLNSANLYNHHGFDRELPGAYSSEYLYDDDRYYDARDSRWDDGRFDLEDYTNYIDRELPAYDAWGSDSWDEEQYALADLLVSHRSRPQLEEAGLTKLSCILVSISNNNSSSIRLSTSWKD